MSTPESNKVSGNAGHSNGAIRKSLLTPYRRIGLSRNRQPSKSNSFVSPLQNKESIIIDNVSLSLDNQSTNPLNENICTTPTVHLYNHKKLDEDTKQKRKLGEDNVCQSLELIRTLSPEIEKKEQRRISEKKEKRRCNKRSSEDNSVEKSPEKGNLNLTVALNHSNTNVINCDLEEKTSKKAKVCDYIKSDDTFINNDHDYVIVSKDNSVKRIVEQTTDNLRDDSIDDNLNVKVVLHRLDSKYSKKMEEFDNHFQESCIGFQKDTMPVNNHQVCLNIDSLINSNEDTNDNIKLRQKSSKSIKRKFSLKKSSSSSNLSEDGEVSNTTNQQDNTPQERSKIIDDIIKLEAIVENKEDELHRLQQAQVYRNMHKVEDLQAETAIWKNGCQEALGDLLIKLNEHNNIDMNSLLFKLKVPSHLISYDSETDCFL